MKEEIVHSLLKGQSSGFYWRSSYADFNRTIIHFLVKEQSCDLIKEIVYIYIKYVLLKEQSSVYIEGAVMFISASVYW